MKSIVSDTPSHGRVEVVPGSSLPRPPYPPLDFFFLRGFSPKFCHDFCRTPTVGPAGDARLVELIVSQQFDAPGESLERV